MHEILSKPYDILPIIKRAANTTAARFMLFHYVCDIIYMIKNELPSESVLIIYTPGSFEALLRHEY